MCGADEGPFEAHFLDTAQQELPEPSCLVSADTEAGEAPPRGMALGLAGTGLGEAAEISGRRTSLSPRCGWRRVAATTGGVRASAAHKNIGMLLPSNAHWLSSQRASAATVSEPVQIAAQIA